MSRLQEERRKFVRLAIALPGQIRKQSDSIQDFQKAITKDVSIAGAYLEVNESVKIESGEDVVVSISVPERERSKFPFSRLVGKAIVKRVDEKAIALEFSRDFSLLSSI